MGVLPTLRDTVEVLEREGYDVEFTRVNYHPEGPVELRERVPGKARIYNSGGTILVAKGAHPDIYGVEMNSLRREAWHVALKRGHRLGSWAPHSQRPRTVASANCVDCGRGLTVKTYPPPNESKIHGAAVTMQCDGRGE